MIKLKEIANIYEIYCDMDGVLTDFDKAFVEISDVPVKDGWEYKTRFGKRKFWKLIDAKGGDFWTEMPWMPTGKMLWNFMNIHFDNVYILSAPS